METYTTLLCPDHNAEHRWRFFLPVKSPRSGMERQSGVSDGAIGCVAWLQVSPAQAKVRSFAGQGDGGNLPSQNMAGGVSAKMLDPGKTGWNRQMDRWSATCEVERL